MLKVKLSKLAKIISHHMIFIINK